MAVAGRVSALIPRVAQVYQRYRQDSLLRNSLYIMGTTVITSLLGYVFWTVAAHAYSVHDVGLASALIAAMTLTGQVSNLGTGMTLIQVLPGRASGRPWSLAVDAALVAGLVAGLIAGLLVTIALPLVSSDFSVLQTHPLLFVLCALSVPVWIVAGTLDYLFVAERAAHRMLLLDTLNSLCKVLLLVPLLLLLGGMGIFSAWVLAGLVACAAGWGVLVPRQGRGYRFSVQGLPSQVASMLSSFVGHHLTNLGGIIPVFLLPIIVTLRLSPTENGYFYLTWMVAGAFFMVSPAVSNALFAEGMHETSQLASTVRRSFTVISSLLIPLMLVMIVGGHLVLDLFGPNYASHGYPLLLLLVASAVPDAITNVYVGMLRVRQRLLFSSLLTMCMGVLAVVLSWVLLPGFGIAGVGWAWLAGQTAGTLVVAGVELEGRFGSRTPWRIESVRRRTVAVKSGGPSGNE